MNLIKTEKYCPYFVKGTIHKTSVLQEEYEGGTIVYVTYAL
jgi:hypothetical protein